jgi:glycosyltransferase involved in cell wall biosynthesis
MMLSVVIPTFQKANLLERTLEALTEQTHGLEADLEVVVVDDGSEDHTAGVLQSWQDALPLRVERPPRNEGRARARNRGWRAARGDWVLFLDDDILLQDGGLNAHIRAQQKQPGVQLGDVITDPSLVDSTLFEYLDTRGIMKRKPGDRVPGRYLLTQNVSIPRAALEQVDGFDERFVAYGFEDMDLAFRLEERLSIAFYRLPGARGLHIHHHSLAEYLDKKRICGRETLPLLARLHPGRMGEMGLDCLPGLPVRLGGRPSLKRLLLALSVAVGSPRLVQSLVARWPRAASRRILFRLYDYLVFAAYAHGFGQKSAKVASIKTK